MKLVGLK